MPAHTLLQTEHNMHAYDISIFTNLHFHSLHGDDSDIVLKNLPFTRFQMFALLGSQNTVVV